MWSARIVACCLVAATMLTIGQGGVAHADSAGGDELLALTNSFRAEVGLPPLPADPRLAAAAQRHADYSARNGVEGHAETPGLPGFSGAAPRDRVAAAGWPGASVSEVATPLLKGALAGVRQIWDGPYHRLALMHPNATAAGWGHSNLGGRERTVGDFAFDFRRSAAAFVRSPAAGQTDIPTDWDNMEIPSPVPDGAATPVGYPIMVVYGGNRRVEMRAAELIAPSGARLPIFYGAQHYGRDYQVVVPRRPLPGGTVLHVRFDLTVDGELLTNEWDFTTAGPLPAPVDIGYHSRWLSQSAAPELQAGQLSGPLTIAFANTGSRPWVRGSAGAQANLGVVEGPSSIGGQAEWPSVDRVAIQVESVVQPGAAATFSFSVRAPPVPGTYVLWLRPVIDGTAWMEDEGVYLPVTVRGP